MRELRQPRTRSRLPWLALAVLVGCDRSDDRWSGPRETSGRDAGAVVSADLAYNGNPGGTPDPGDPGEPGTCGTGQPDTEGLWCPCAKQYLLILDFRSGWWTAGGGFNFYTIVMPFLAKICGGTKLEYHHYEAAQPAANGNPPTPQTQWQCLYDGPAGSCTNGGFQDILSSIVEQDWTKFTQIWILSGDKEDPSDIGDGDAIFKAALAKTANACTPFLLGAGDGFITHGNVAANAIGLGGDVFAKDNPAAFFEWFGFPPTISTHLTVGKELTADPLFTSADIIADKLTRLIQTTRGDRLLPNALMTVVGKDTQGRPQIAYGRIPINGTPGRPFVLEAGMQRYYALGLNDPKTGYLLKNLVKYLGSVGCKSTEEGWPIQ